MCIYRATSAAASLLRWAPALAARLAARTIPRAGPVVVRWGNTANTSYGILEDNTQEIARTAYKGLKKMGKGSRGFESDTRDSLSKVAAPPGGRASELDALE